MKGTSYILRKSSTNALAYGDSFVTYNELIARIRSFSSEISSLRMNKGDRVVILCENRPEWIIAIYSIWMSGGIAVPVDFMSTPAEIAYIIDDCKPALVFCSEKTESALVEAIKTTEHLPIVVRIADGMKGSDEGEYPAVKHDDCAVIIYTSGTTGSPKGVMLSFGNLLAVTETLTTGKYGNDHITFSPEERLVAILPFHHVYPLQATLFAPLYAGEMICFVKEILASEIISVCKRHKITRLFGIPRLYAGFHKGIMSKVNASPIGRILFKIIRAFGAKKLGRIVFSKVHAEFGGHIRAFMSGGSKIDPAISRDLEALGFSLIEGYGMTEAAPSITICSLSRYKIGTVGFTLPGGELKVVDGELLYKGPNVMMGYYNRPEETAAVFDSDGFLKTGDRAEIDAQGFVTITGRLKEIIILSNGKNVNPEEIENSILTSFPVVKDIGVIENEGRLFAVIVPDFAQIAAMNVMNINEAIRWDVIDRYNATAPHHMKVMDFAIVEADLPRTRIGKLKRFALMEMISNKKEKKPVTAESDQAEVPKALSDIIFSITGHAPLLDDHIELDLAMDSLDRVELQARIEETYGIVFSSEEIAQRPRVKDLAEFLSNCEHKSLDKSTDWGTIIRNAASIRLKSSVAMLELLLSLTLPVRWLYFRVRAEGKTKVPDSSPVIFAPNHQCALDAFLLMALLKGKTLKRTFVFAKDKHFASWFRRFFARRANIVLMNINRDLKGSIQRMASLAQQGNNIVIFPEGTRTRNGEIGSFKKMFAILAKETGIPVIPVAIDGAYKLFKSPRKIPKPGKIRIAFLDPVYPEGKSYDEIVSATRSAIAKKVTGLTAGA